MNNAAFSQQDAYDLIRSFSGQANVLTIPRAFISFTGDLECALVLSQLLYWHSRCGDGWTYKTFAEWEAELGLSEYKVNKARKKLEAMGLLTTKVAKAAGAPTVHYHLNESALVTSLSEFLRNGNRKALGMETEETSESKPKKLRNPITETPTKTTTTKTSLVPNDVPIESSPFDVVPSNGSKPTPTYICPYCSRVYQRRGHLTRHIRLVHGDEPDHPALTVFRSLTDRDPTKAQRDAILAEVAEAATWEAVVRRWLVRGYKPTNVDGMLEWYRREVEVNGASGPSGPIIRR